MGHICFSALPNCYAPIYSYGQICVWCNCCGRQEAGLKMWEARLELHQSEYDRNINFSEWLPKFKEMQQRNIKLNITYHKSKIKKCTERVKYFTDKLRTE